MRRRFRPPAGPLPLARLFDVERPVEAMLHPVLTAVYEVTFGPQRDRAGPPR